MRAVKTYAEINPDKSLTLTSLPFLPGSKVEVIVLPASDGEDAFSKADSIVKKRGIRRLTMKQVENMIHDFRGVA